MKGVLTGEEGVVRRPDSRPGMLGLLLLGVHGPHGNRGIVKGRKTVGCITFKHPFTAWLIDLNTQPWLTCERGYFLSSVLSTSPGQQRPPVAVLRCIGEGVSRRACLVSVALRPFRNGGKGRPHLAK